jgi:hypothetical protein
MNSTVIKEKRKNIIFYKPPSDMLNDAGQIECRRCRKKCAEWPQNAKPHAKSAILSKLMEHEKFCAGKY